MSSRPAADRSDPRAGFALLETLVAGTVAVILLVALLRAFGSIWDLNVRVREDAESMIVARAVLEAATLRDGLSSRAQEGRAGAYGWAVDIESAPIEERPEPPPPSADTKSSGQGEKAEPEEEKEQWQLYRIKVAVNAPSGRRTFLETLKLGPLLR